MKATGCPRHDVTSCLMCDWTFGFPHEFLLDPRRDERVPRPGKAAPLAPAREESTSVEGRR